MKATATLPDGATRSLIWINDWDFNWQDSYVYKEPFTLPKGTRIDVTLIYDNSSDNPRNPIDPPRRALWGEESFDEMGSVGFSSRSSDKADVPVFPSRCSPRARRGGCGRWQGWHPSAVLARQQRQARGLQQFTVFDCQGHWRRQGRGTGLVLATGVLAGRLPGWP